MVAAKLEKPLLKNIVQGDQIRPGYDRRYALVDNNLKATGFKPPFTFDETLSRIINWARENKHWIFE